jgi:hypothetical protein
MADPHQPDMPVVLEQLVSGLRELEIVLGDVGRATLPAVRASLTAAMAARDRGDPVAALRAIGTAMTQLASLADRLDPQEAAMMRMVTDRFRSALLRGDLPEAKQDMDVMFTRSGSTEKKTKD